MAARGRTLSPEPSACCPPAGPVSAPPAGSRDSGLLLRSIRALLRGVPPRSHSSDEESPALGALRDGPSNGLPTPVRPSLAGRWLNHHPRACQVGRRDRGLGAWRKAVSLGLSLRCLRSFDLLLPPPCPHRLRGLRPGACALGPVCGHLGWEGLRHQRVGGEDGYLSFRSRGRLLAAAPPLPRDLWPRPRLRMTGVG